MAGNKYFPPPVRVSTSVDPDRCRAAVTPSRRLRHWNWVHTWSSLVCTLFMLLLCVTGLPLVFYHEIDHALGRGIEAPPMPAGTPRASLDRVLEVARGHHSGLVPLYLFADQDEPHLWTVKMDVRPDTDEAASKFVVIDARSAAVLGEPRFDQGFMHLVFRLHVDLFAGLPGRLFLGAMGLMLIASLVSGIVLYAPFMRRLDFATVRRGRSPQLRRLDMHNLLGIVTVSWALVVGATGVINTLAELILKAWQQDRIMALHGAHRLAGTPTATAGGSLQAVAAAIAAAPDRRVHTIAFPGTLLSTPTHYTVLLQGDTPLTSKLLDPVLVEAGSGAISDAAPRPWYVTALLLSQPLHFGDYGGLPLKVLWALLDAVTLYVLWGGLLLWWRKAKRPAPSASLSPTKAA